MYILYTSLVKHEWMILTICLVLCMYVCTCIGLSLSVYLNVQENGKTEDGKEGEDYRVSVIDTSTGKKITGEEAPLKSELEQWLQEHPKSVKIQ